MSSFPSPSPSLVSDNKHGLYRTDNTLTQPYMVTIHVTRAHVQLWQRYNIKERNLTTGAHKTAELPQKWPRDAPHKLVSWKFSRVRTWLLFPKVFMGFWSDRSYKCAYKVWSRSLTRSWDNRCTQKYGQSLDTPTLPFLRNFYGLLFGWTLWMMGQIWSP